MSSCDFNDDTQDILNMEEKHININVIITETSLKLACPLFTPVLNDIS